MRARAAAEGECARRRPRTICRRTAYSTLAPEDMLTRVSEGCNPHNHDFSSKHIRREMFRRERTEERQRPSPRDAGGFREKLRSQLGNG